MDCVALCSSEGKPVQPTINTFSCKMLFVFMNMLAGEGVVPEDPTTGFYLSGAGWSSPPTADCVEGIASDGKWSRPSTGQGRWVVIL